MKRFFWIITTYFIFLAVSPIGNPAFAGTEKFDAAMQPVLVEYLKIADRLASDKTDGVNDAAKKMAGLAGGVAPSLATGGHAAHYAGISKKIADAAKKMAEAKDIEAMRNAFVELSKPMVMWASMSMPSGINVIYCPMKPGSWLQKGATIHNPYYGAAMASCGEIISGPDAKK